MSASGQNIAAAVSQYRNAMLNAVLNKVDPFIAIAMAENMMATIPPTLVSDEMKKDMPKAPQQGRDWVEDPDTSKFQSEAWNYWKRMSNWVERVMAKVTIDQLSQYRS